MKGIRPVALCLFIPILGCGPDGRNAEASDPLEIESDSSFILTLTNGQRVRFTDTNRGDPAGRDYTAEDVFESIEAVLVHVQFWEGHAYLLVHRTNGDTTWLDSAPVFSPEGDRFLTASFDLEAGYVPNRVGIYSASPAGVELEWSLEAGGTEWGPLAAEWRGNDTVRFVRAAQQWEPDFRCVRAPMVMVRSGTGWRIQTAGEEGDTVDGICG